MVGVLLSVGPRCIREVLGNAGGFRCEGGVFGGGGMGAIIVCTAGPVNGIMNRFCVEGVVRSGPRAV